MIFSTRRRRSKKIQAMASTFPTVDASRLRLHRSGWSIGETATAGGWIANGNNGENAILARGASQEEARHWAVKQAETVGMAGGRHA